MSGTIPPAHGGTPNGRANGLAARAAEPRPALGVLEWFHFNDDEHAERAVAQMRRLGVERLRFGVSWADCFREGGLEWLDRLFPRLAAAGDLLPCVLYTPPSLGVAPKTSSPPRNPKAYADFIDVLITRYGEHFRWIELWNEPNNPSEWDWTLDREWATFAGMIGMAAHWARRCGKKVALGGMSPVDPEWLALMAQRGVLAHVDAVGIHGFPGTWEFQWLGWDRECARVREAMARCGFSGERAPELWITEAGHSTWRRDELRQLREFLDAMSAPVDRVYWYGLEDLDPERATVDGDFSDEREYHFGIYAAGGRRPKLLARALEAGGVGEAHRLASIAARRPDRAGRRATVITGGAGFVGTNLAERLLERGERVVLYDALSRDGVLDNVDRLSDRFGGAVELRIADVRDRRELRSAIAEAARVFHFAAQVAVTTSLDDPVDDHGVNVQGALHLLEELRRLGRPVPLLFTSTNKVYGGLGDLELVEGETRYEPADRRARTLGVSEQRPLAFCSPYGCSKGAADQYVIDYANAYGLPTVVFRMSCIYGRHQCGNEDQGWIAHFVRSAVEGRPLNVYGDGKQVRDALWAGDLVDAQLLAMERIGDLSGRAFNIGGGPGNTLSLIELLGMIAEDAGRTPDVRYGPWRTSDQRWYVSDVTAFRAATGWAPRVRVRDGVRRLHRWISQTLLGVAPGDAAKAAITAGTTA